MDIFFYHPKQNVEYPTFSSAELTFIQSVQGSLLFIHFWCPSLSMLFKLLLTYSKIDVVARFLLGWWSRALGNSGSVKLNLLVTSTWALLSLQWLVVLCNSLWQKSKQNRGSQEDGVLKCATVNVSGWANVLTRGLVKSCSDFPWRRRTIVEMLAPAFESLVWFLTYDSVLRWTGTTFSCVLHTQGI